MLPIRMELEAGLARALVAPESVDAIMLASVVDESALVEF